MTIKKPLTIHHIRSRKSSDKPLVCLTAYTAPMAKILDKHCDMLLVGDSLGMVIYGMESTLNVTVDMMIAHGKAVSSSVSGACVIVDMPFGSYQASPQQAFTTAAQILAQTGCQAIKIEGGQEMASTVEFLTQRGIPVVGHIGLKPQSVRVHGGYGPRGKAADESKAIMADALAIQNAGAFALVIESVPESLAHDITQQLTIPTIGIGASNKCDGQILVTEDMLGLFDEFKPKFVKRYAQLAQIIDDAVADYANEVTQRTFPEAEHMIKDKQEKRA